MRSEDKATLSTWIEYLKSLKMYDDLDTLSLKYDPNAQIVVTGINENLYNSVILQNPSNNLKLIQELREMQKDLHLPLTVWITIDQHSSPLHQLLNENFQSPGAFYGMLLDLSKAKLATNLAANICIEPVISQQQIETYAQVFSQTFNFPNLMDPTIQWLTQQNKIKDPSAFNYIATIDGTVVGVCSLTIDRKFNEFKTGGLYNACVLPEYRKQGIGTAMALHRVSLAKELGLKYLSILLMSDAMARGYCERLGFVNYSALTPYFIS